MFFLKKIITFNINQTMVGSTSPLLDSVIFHHSSEEDDRALVYCLCAVEVLPVVRGDIQ